MTEIEADAALSGGARGAVELRHMRVETDFRRATQSLERQERDKYSSMLWNMIRMDRKPKVAILDLVGPRGDNDIDYRDEISLKASVDHYHRLEDQEDDPDCRIRSFFDRRCSAPGGTRGKGFFPAGRKRVDQASLLSQYPLPGRLVGSAGNESPFKRCRTSQIHPS